MQMKYSYFKRVSFEVKKYIRIGVVLSFIFGFSLIFSQQAFANQAPTARISIYPDYKETFTTNDTIRVNGYESSDPDTPGENDVGTYRWEVYSHNLGYHVYGANHGGPGDFTPNVHAGKYTITLKVTDSGGLYHVAAKDITIEQGEYPPVARFSYTANKATKEVVFDASELSFDEDGQITEYKWNFGDGTEQIGGAEVTHQYEDIKPYTVRLTVTDDDRRSGTFSLPVVPMSQTELLACMKSVTGTMNAVVDEHSHKVTLTPNLTSETCPEFTDLDLLIDFGGPEFDFGGEILDSRTEEEDSYVSVHYSEPGSYTVKAWISYAVKRTYSAKSIYTAPETTGNLNFADVEVIVAEPEFVRITTCADGLDNDDDGAVDYPLDEECSGLQDDDEGPAEGTRGLHVSFYTEPGIVQSGQETKIIVEVAEWVNDRLRCGLDVNPRNYYISGNYLDGVCEHTHTFSGKGPFEVEYSVSNQVTGEYLRLDPIIIKPGSGEVSGSGSSELTTVLTTNPSIIEDGETARITVRIAEWENDKKRCMLRVDGKYAGFAGFWSDEDADQDIATCSAMYKFEEPGRYDVSFSVLNNRTRESVLLAAQEIEIVEDRSAVTEGGNGSGSNVTTTPPDAVVIGGGGSSSDISYVVVGDDSCDDNNATDCSTSTTTNQNYDITINNPLGDTDTIWKLVDKIITLVQLIAIPLIVLFIVYAGFLFVTSQGNEQKLARAKKALLAAVIGSLIILGAEAISQLIQGTIDQLGSGT